MQKIMFNDKYGLTQAVLEGKKTQTRRLITHPKVYKGKDVAGFYVCRRLSDGWVSEVSMYDEEEASIDEGQILPKYRIGEVVAVAQSYKDCGYNCKQYNNSRDYGFGYLFGCGIDEIPMKYPINGYKNKMFVKPELMPHQIRITNVRVERLQDISDEDCLAEGIIKGKVGSEDTHFMDSYYIPNKPLEPICTPREAYAELIDNVSGKGTWNKNPYVWVYDFELIK